MNREYRKFDEPADVYIPPATEPEHFSNMPDVLIPADYQEPEGDPLEKDVADLIRETKTPPPTPPEEEPGMAGCRVFRERNHYVAPIYSDPAYERHFTMKLLMGHIATYFPALVVQIILMTVEEFDYMILNSAVIIALIFGTSLAAIGVYIYFVGLFRNPPIIYMALTARVLLQTLVTSCAMLLVHACFLRIITHPENQEQEQNQTGTFNPSQSIEETDIIRMDHAPAYMTVLILLLMGFVNAVIVILMKYYHYSIMDYRVPFIIYTTCNATSALLTTVVLNKGFNHEPPSYDLFQVITAGIMASFILMRIPHFFSRLYEGKVCPLREGEFLYALIHFGL